LVQPHEVELLTLGSARRRQGELHRSRYQHLLSVDGKS
jgi:hypothetical protein